MIDSTYTDEQRQALGDLAAFLGHCLETGEHPFDVVLRTLDHDVQGLGSPDPTFVPRTAGYARRGSASETG
jgi:hypothetical protein